MDRLVAKLAGGDRRSIGRSNEVVADVLARPELFSELVRAMTSNDPVVRIRAADAVEKVSRTRADLVAPHKALLFGRFASAPDKEVRWHVVQILPRIVSTDADKTCACNVLLAYLVDDSSIVKTCAMMRAPLRRYSALDARARGERARGCNMHSRMRKRSTRCGSHFSRISTAI